MSPHIKIFFCVLLIPSLIFAKIYDQAETAHAGVSVGSTQISQSSYHVEFTTSQNSIQVWNQDEISPVITRWIAVSDEGSVSLRNVDLQSSIPIDSNQSFLSSEELVTVDCITIGEESLVQGVRLVPIYFNPVIKKGESFEVVQSASVDVEFSGGPAPFEKLTWAARQMLGDLVLNNNSPRRDDNGEGSGYVYVVPQDNRVRELLEPLYNWRRQQGFDVQELVIQDRLNDGLLLDQLQVINNNLMRRTGMPLEYICLVGDTGGEFAVPTTLHGTSDYHYSLLDGDDIIPEAAVGRISYNSIGELNRIINKILTYERQPDLDNVDWHRRGAVSAGNPQSGYSTILVGRWLRDQMFDFGFTEVDTFWYTMDGGVANFMQRSFDRGMSFINYRGWTGLEDWSVFSAGRLANRHLPVALLLGCSTGDYSGIGAGHTEALLRAQGGAIGAIGSSTLQSRVNYNNALLAGYYRGVFDGEVCRLGWTLNRAKMELLATYGAYGRDWVVNHAYWTNLMGDPATVIWRGTPRRVNIQVAEEVEISFDPIEVQITSNDQPVPGVRVGLYQENGTSAAGYTDEDGFALITYNPALLEAGAAQITVSGDRVVPTSENIQLIPSPNLINFNGAFILDEDFDPFAGNGDGIIQPFETFGFMVSFTNLGDNAINAPIDLNLTCEHEGINVIEANIRLEQDINPGWMISGQFLVESLGRFPDNEPVPFVCTLSWEDEEVAFDIDMTGEAPRISFGAFRPVFDIEAGANEAFNIGLTNTGSLDFEPSEGFLESLSEWVEVFAEEGQYEVIDVGDLVFANGEMDLMFQIQIAWDAPDGAVLPLRLTLVADDGMEVEVPIMLQIGGGGAPAAGLTGPDEFGYWAIDDRDFGNNLSPIYNWEELNPDMGGLGTNTGLLDQAEDDDDSVVLDLPFEFTYYGEAYNQLTVCTNGWAAFGDQSDYVDFRNLPIGSPQGPGAQLCPWWDDLYQPEAEGNVFYYYDEANHRFIVEWYHMSRYVGPAGPGAEETFEIILLDPDWHYTNTGNGDIIFQYQDVELEARIDGYSTPYATIGIGNPEDNGGLQYGYWNEWTEGSAPLARSSAIRFSTSDNHDFATVSGTVTALQGGNPIAGAVVRSTTGGWTVTDDFGLFENLNVLADLPFQIEASMDGYNVIRSDEQQLNQDDVAVVNLALTQPRMAVDVMEISVRLQAGDEVATDFTISNGGNGTLDFAVNLSPTLEQMQNNDSGDPDRDDPDDLWDQLITIAVSEIVEDNRVLGAAYVNGEFWVSGGANGENENFFYIFSQDGNLQRRVRQPVDGLWGVHDLAFDGEFLYGGSRDLIYVMDSEGELQETIDSPLIPPRALTVDPDNGDIWVVNDSAPIHRLDSDGNTLATYPQRLRPYGLAWHPADEDGYPLYIFSADGLTNLLISKLDPESGNILHVAELELREGDRAGGCELALDLDSRNWSLITVVQNAGGDRVEVFDAGTNYAWITYEPESGQVNAGENIDITVNLNADQLDRGFYSADLVVNHNAVGDDLRMPVELTVDPQVNDVPELSPTGFELTTIYPNPTNGYGTVSFSLPTGSEVQLSVWDNAGRQVVDIYNGYLKAGTYAQTFIAGDIPSGVYFVSLETNGGIITRKFALMK
ncbi:MAG: T9SS type A sorting domain-containing protein [Calditrichaeota bacterium]|nr:T9SS type A sorting domain-containing protein [Calditrichota bacterium]